MVDHPSSISAMLGFSCSGWKISKYETLTNVSDDGTKMRIIAQMNYWTR